jgi:hypothetical protein
MASEKIKREFKDCVIKVEILSSNEDSKRYHDGLETYLFQEISDIFPELDTSKNISWDQLKNIVAIRLRDRRYNYQDLEYDYSRLRIKYLLSIGLNVSFSLYFLIKWFLK